MIEAWFWFGITLVALGLAACGFLYLGATARKGDDR